MSNRPRPASTRKGGAPAAALLGGAKTPSKIIEGETVPDSETAANAAEAEQRAVLEHQALVREGKLEDVSLAEHKRRQAEYRAQVEQFAAQVNDIPAPDVEEFPEPSQEEREEARRQEELERQAAWLQAYAEALEADRGQPQYVVGSRPPRPKWQGVQLNIGDVVPGAHAWPRLDSWIRTGVVTARPMVTV